MRRDGEPLALAPESTPVIRFDASGHEDGNVSVDLVDGGYTVGPSGTLRRNPPDPATTQMSRNPLLIQQRTSSGARTAAVHTRALPAHVLCEDAWSFGLEHSRADR